MIITDCEKIHINVNTSHMEQWAILSNVIAYVQYNRNHIDYFKLDILASESKCHQRIYEWLEDDGQVTN